MRLNTLALNSLSAAALTSSEIQPKPARTRTVPTDTELLICLQHTVIVKLYFLIVLINVFVFQESLTKEECLWFITSCRMAHIISYIPCMNEAWNVGLDWDLIHFPQFKRTLLWQQTTIWYILVICINSLSWQRFIYCSFFKCKIVVFNRF